MEEKNKSIRNIAISIIVIIFLLIFTVIITLYVKTNHDRATVSSPITVFNSEDKMEKKFISYCDDNDLFTKDILESEKSAAYEKWKNNEDYWDIVVDEYGDLKTIDLNSRMYTSIAKIQSGFYRCESEGISVYYQ